MKPGDIVDVMAGWYDERIRVQVSGTVGKPSAEGITRDYSAVTHNRIAYNKVYHCEYGFILGGVGKNLIQSKNTGLLRPLQEFSATWFDG